MTMTDEEFKREMARYDRIDMVSNISIGASLIAIIITILTMLLKPRLPESQHASPDARQELRVSPGR